MTNRPDAVRTPWIAAALAASVVFAAGCEKKESHTGLGGRSGSTKAQAAARPAPPPPVRAALTPADLQLAPGAQFPAQLIPTDESAARAVAALANAVATGDADALAGMIDRSDAAVLGHLRESGDWDRATDSVTVRVVAVEPADPGVRVGIAIEDQTGAYLIGWEGAPTRNAWTFRSLPVESPPAARASDLDGVALALMDIPAPGPALDEAAPARPPVNTKPQRRRSGRRRGLGG